MSYNCLINDYNRMPQVLVDIITANIRAKILSPSGSWADYNCLYNAVEQLNLLTLPIGTGPMCPEDVPPFPNVNDYENLTSPPTIECPCIPPSDQYTVTIDQVPYNDQIIKSPKMCG